MNKYLKIFLNLSLIGLGLGVIVGSLLRITSLEVSERKLIDTSNIELNKKTKKLDFDFIKKGKRIEELDSKWELLASQNADLDASAFLLILDDYKFATYYPKKILPAASTIKIPILLVALEMIDSGELLLNEKVKLEKELIGSGAGWMAYEPLGTYFPIHELATEMIRISDNTATNILIKRLGGLNKINKRLKEIGLESTQINNLLPDLKGTNLTSVIDLCYLIALVDSGNFLSPRSRDLFREILGTSTSNKLLPKGILNGLGKYDENIDYRLMIKGYRVYNKTGDIGITYADAGLIQMPDNTRAVAGFIVKGPFNDPRSSELIRKMATALIEAIEPR